jgi:hypothetical protein
VLKAILMAFQSRGKRFLKTSFNALVAHQIGGDTFCSTIGWNSNKGHMNVYKPFAAHELSNFYFDNNISPDAPNGSPEALDRIAGMFIDEISTNSPEMISFLDQRLRQAFRDDERPFGGLTIVMFGDFNQKGPVQAQSLPRGAIECTQVTRDRKAFHEQMEKRSAVDAPSGQTRHRVVVRPKNDKYSAGHPYYDGVEIITNVRRRQLTEQVRAKDPKHAALVEKMFKGEKLSVRDFNCYRRLSREDLENDDWLDAPVLTSTNRERFAFTHSLAKARALQRNTVVVRWRSVLGSQWIQRPETEEARREALEDPALFEYFVKGCHAYIMKNINKKLGIVNGAQVRYHSLSFASDEIRAVFEELMAETQVGEVCTLPDGILPHSVNVEFEEVHGWPEAVSLLPGRNVVPIPCGTYKVAKCEGFIALPGGNTAGQAYRPSKVQVTNYFPIDPGFAITFYKVQGRTLLNLIIALSGRSIPVCNLDYSDVYVAFSRVAEAVDIRLLLSDTDSSFESIHYVSSLKQDLCTAAFLHGFDDTGDHWNPLRALLYYVNRGGKKLSSSKQET